jgi:citrate lyase subunit beta / citryl-CoA lyase
MAPSSGSYDAARLRRTTLVVPANRPHMIAKAATIPTDVVMLDMEDAVVYTETAKQEARDAVADGLDRLDFGPREVIVRVNPIDSPWFEADLALVVRARPHAVVPAKLTCGEDVVAVAHALDRAGAPPELRIWAGIETVSAVLRSDEIATASPRVELMRFGIGDYTVTMQGQFADTQDHLLYPLTHVLAVARDRGLDATGAAVIFSDIRRLDLIRTAAQLMRKLGYDGVTVIHPSHVDVANEVFTPTTEEIAWALRQEELLNDGGDQAVAVIDGRLVEQVNVKLARRTLGTARALGLLPTPRPSAVL